MAENQKVVQELEKLFERVPPQELRKSIESIFRVSFIDRNKPFSDEQRKMVANFYFLDLFLTEIEKEYQANRGAEDLIGSI